MFCCNVTLSVDRLQDGAVSGEVFLEALEVGDRLNLGPGQTGASHAEQAEQDHCLEISSEMISLPQEDITQTK